MLRSLCIALLLALSFALPSAVRAAFDPLTLVPSDYEVVASLNTRQIVDSPLFGKVWAELQTPQTNAKLGLVKSLTGVDPLKDIDRVWLFSRVNDDDSAGVVAEGRFDEARLLQLVQANGAYKASEVSGRTVHEWYDEGEKQTKFAVFPAKGVVAVWNSRMALDASMKALVDPASSIKGSPDAAVVPAGADALAGWGIMIVRDSARPAAKLRVTNATMTMTTANDAMTTRLLVTPETKEAATQWLDMAKGAKALGLLQRDNPNLSEFAKLVSVESRNDGAAVEVSGTIDAAKMIDMVRKKKQNAK